MTNYRQTEGCFRNEKYQYEKPPDRRVEKAGYRSARDNLVGVSKQDFYLFQGSNKHYSPVFFMRVLVEYRHAKVHV
jgi:hypothetical protein